MKYFIAQQDVDWSDDRWKYKGGTGLSPKKRIGFIGLFDRNIGRFIWFKIIEKSETKFGWIVDRKAKLPPYWQGSLQEV